MELMESTIIIFFTPEVLIFFFLANKSIKISRFHLYLNSQLGVLRGGTRDGFQGSDNNRSTQPQPQTDRQINRHTHTLPQSPLFLTHLSLDSFQCSIVQHSDRISVHSEQMKAAEAHQK